MAKHTTNGDPRLDQLLDYWFGREADDAVVASSQAGLWWQHDPAVDADVRRRFEGLAELAASGALASWGHQPRSVVGLILLLDQVPRNVWRGTPRAFATDAMARTRALRLIESGHDRELRAIHRLFVYLPLEHAEDLGLQALCVERLGALVAEVPAAWRETFEGFVDYAVRHHEVIERFGRFPHRNAILGRRSTPAEAQYLAEPGAGF